MAYVILPSRRRRPDVFELDHSHPLAQGLVFAGLGNMPSLLSGGKYLDSSPAQCVTNATGTSPIQMRLDESIGRYVCSFDATKSQAVDLGPSLGFTLVEFSYGAWVRSGAVNTFPISSRTTLSTSGYDLLIGNNSVVGRTQFRCAVTASITWPNIELPGIAHDLYHLMWVAKIQPNTDLRAEQHVNGVYNSINGPIPSITNSQNFHLAKRGVTFFTGDIADPVFYNRALSPEEIKVLANRTDPMLGGLIRDKKPVQKYWHLGALPDDCKVKTVTAVPLQSSAFSPTASPSLYLPRKKKRDNVFDLDDDHSLAQGLVLAWLPVDGGRYRQQFFHNGIIKNINISQYQANHKDKGLEIGRGAMACRGTNYNSNTLYFGNSYFPTNLFSVSFLFKADSSSTGNMVSKASAWNNGFGVRPLSTTTISIRIGGSALDIWYPKSVWNSFYIFCDGSDAYVYLNGVLKNTMTRVSGFFNGTTLEIGGNSYDSAVFSTGSVSDLLVYDRRLADKEIKILSDLKDPGIGGLIREPKPRTIYAYNAKYNIVGTQDANTLKWNWGSNNGPDYPVYENIDILKYDGSYLVYDENRLVYAGNEVLSYSDDVLFYGDEELIYDVDGPYVASGYVATGYVKEGI